MKTKTIPAKIYSWQYLSGELYYYLTKSDWEQGNHEGKLDMPEWFDKLIKEERKEAYTEGKNDLKRELNSLLGI